MLEINEIDGFNDVQIARVGEKPPLVNGIDLSEHNLSKYENEENKMPEVSIRNKMNGWY